MTTIAWDGKYLCADKQAYDGTKRFKVCKVKKIGKLLVGGCGDFPRISALMAWVEAGRKIHKFPQDYKPSPDVYNRLLIIEKGKILVYEESPYPFEVTTKPGEKSFFAIGSGAAYAMSYMSLFKEDFGLAVIREEGMPATLSNILGVGAIKHAAKFDPNTGMGVDVIS